MPIRRERVTKNYTAIANRVLRDRRLKGEEKGLQVWLLSHDPNWKIIIPVVMREMGWGRDKTYRILKRLSQFGYVNRTQERDPASGAFGGVSYTVFSNPDDNSEYLAEAVEPRLPDLPLPEKSKASKEESIDIQKSPPTPSLNPGQKPEGSIQNAPQPTSKRPVPTFDQFWNAYAPDAYMPRNKTERQWHRMIPADRQGAFNAVVTYLADCRAKNRIRVNVSRYLRDKTWQGFSVAAKTIAMTTVKPGSPEWDAWRKYLVATQSDRVAFFDYQGQQSKTYTVPTRWPPGTAYGVNP
jgi:hypothetical protein